MNGPLLDARKRLSTERWRWVVCACLPLLMGCQNDIRSGGSDVKYLEALPKPTLIADAKNPILPLTKGNFWEMTAYRQNPEGTVKTSDRYLVTGPIVVDGVQGTEVQIQRNGAKWRREIYRTNGDTLELVAAQDENSELMRYNPPIPLVKYPAKAGDYQTWNGYFSIKDRKFGARAESRIAAQENVRTPAGIFKTLRIDTVIVIGEGEIKFPSVRWLAPGVGFVRRGYAEQGKPATAEVTRFNVQ